MSSAFWGRPTRANDRDRMHGFRVSNQLSLFFALAVSSAFPVIAQRASVGKEEQAKKISLGRYIRGAGRRFFSTSAAGEAIQSSGVIYSRLSWDRGRKAGSPPPLDNLLSGLGPRAGILPNRARFTKQIARGASFALVTSGMRTLRLEIEIKGMNTTIA